jgi:PAS domain S-box-containing protein
MPGDGLKRSIKKPGDKLRFPFIGALLGPGAGRVDRFFENLLAGIFLSSAAYLPVYWVLGARLAAYALLFGILFLIPLALWLRRQGSDAVAAREALLNALQTKSESEEEVRRIIESMSEGLVIHDSDGKIVSANPAARAILMLSEGEVLGRTSMDPKWRAIREDGSDFPGESHPAMVALRTGQKVAGTIMGLRMPSGEARWIRITATPFSRDERQPSTGSGERQFAMATFADVTDILNTRAQLEEAQHVAEIGSWSIDLASQKLSCSSQMFKMFDVAAIGGQPTVEKLQAMIYEGDRSLVAAKLRNCASDGQPFRMSFCSVFPKKTLDLEIVCEPRRDLGGKVVEIHGTCQDVTKRVQLEKDLQLERAKAAQAAKLAALGEISAGIAHEINNPLAIISGTTHLLEKVKADPIKFSAKLAVIQKSTERIAKIVVGLRKFARSSAQQTKKVEVLADIVREALALIGSAAARHDIAIKAKLDCDARVLCDEVEIEQVIVNLVSNAIDAVKALPERWVELGLGDEPGAVVLWVRDSGPRISPEIEDKIFQPFFTTKPVGQGTGLGLSISKGILGDHGASISLRPGDDNTCFEIRFEAVGR